MITQQLGYSILTAPLAAIDRRALSQAWYSALHLARQCHAEATREATHPAGCRSGAVLTRIDETSVKSRGTATVPRAVDRRSMRGAVGTPERRAGRSLLARSIERTFLDSARPVRRATFTLEGMHEGTRARVHVALQSGASGVRLVAVCPAALRARVARALDQARYALAARGVRLVGIVQ